MKKILSIILAILMIVTTVPFAFAAEGIRTIYLIVPGEYISETDPFELYLHTDEDIYTWQTDGYTEKIIPETDYQGNVPEEGAPAIFKISFSDDYTHLKYSGGGYGSSPVLTLTDADVYADAHEEILAIEITPEEISEISIIEASGSPVTIAENEKAVIFSSEYYGIPYGSVNNGTVLATYTRNKFINNGTVMGGIFSYIENNGVISGGKFNYSVINNGTVNGGDFSDEASVIYSFEGATVSDSVKENALVITSQPVTFELTNLTHDAETLVTTPNEYYFINLYADEGYAVPENITVTVDGVTTDKFSYEVDKTSLKASLGIWRTAPTGPITITAAGETGTFAKVSNLYLGETKIVANSILRQSSGDNWSYDVDTNTLTLDNFELITTGEKEPGLYCEGNLNLILKGENLIDNSASDETNEAVFIEGDFYISGTENDSLTVKGSSCTGRSKRAICAYRLLEVSGCKIYSYGGNSVYSYGISALEIKIKDNASVTGVAGESTGGFNYGVEVSGILNIDSGIITGIGNENIDGSIGIRNYGMVINGGTVEAYGNGADVNVFGDVSIDTDAELKLLRSTIANIEDGEYYWDAEKHEFVCTGHTGGELTCIGYKCTNCKQYYGQGDGESHFGGTATCTTPKKCTGCGELYGENDYDNHSWSNSICTECEIVCTHTDEDNNSLCDACGFFDGADINLGEKLTVAHSLYLRFIPNVSGKYIIFSESTSDPKIILYNAELDSIDSADDSYYNEDNGYDFYLEYEFTAGETYYFEFYDCNDSYNYSVIFECKEHQGGEADCTNKAKCEVCGTEYGETDKEVHNWSNNDGICANGCGKECNHSFTNYVETRASTCKIAGKEVATCDNGCGVTDERELPLLDHEPGEQMCRGYWCSRCRSFYGEGNPDVHVDGYISSKVKDGLCDGCGKCLAKINAGETYEINSYAYVVEFAPVVDGRYILTVDGPEGTEIDVREVVDGVNKGINCEVISDLVYVVDCTVGKTYIFEVSNYYGYNISSMTLECETHKSTEQTCYGYICDACGEYFGEVPGHDIVIDEAKAPTCTETGLTEGSHCSRCDDMTVAQEEIPALNHKDTLVKVDAKASTCTEAGHEAYEYCTACDYTTYKEIPASHDIIIDEAVAPKCGESGLTQGEHCTRCDYKVEQEIVPALEHKDADGDYQCDYGCGHEFEKPAPEEPTDKACDHLCHKDGFVGFIWKIVQFFWKLFKMNPVCECGAAHY